MFKDNLRAERHRKHLTQEELADKVGLHYKTIMKFESGESEPSLSMIHKLANALDVDIIKLLKG